MTCIDCAVEFTDLSGRALRCPPCRVLASKARGKRWHEANRERHLQQMRDWGARHRHLPRPRGA